MARTFTAGQRTAIGSSEVAHALRLEVEDPDATYRDLSTYFTAGDYVVDFRLEKTIDANCWTMRATLLRDDGSTASLAPLRENSDLNVDGMAAYAPFLDVGRKWRASVSVQSIGTSHSYTVFCEGYIDTVVVNDPEPTITLTGRDLGASLLDCWITTETEYGAYQEFSNTDWGAVTITDSGETATFASGTLETDGIEPGWFLRFSNLSVGGNNDVWVKIESVDSETVLGLASGGLADNASDAAWSVEVAKNMETVLQELLDDNLTSPPTLEVETSPSFLMNPYTQQKESLMVALNRVAQLAAQTVSYRYDSSNNFKLTLWAPDRDATAGGEVWTVGPSEYTALPTADIDIEGVRNKVVLQYYDGSAFATHTESDATSIARYGGDHAIPRTLEIDLAQDAQIVTSARANTLAEAILSDLKDPAFEQQFEVPGFWIADLGDFGKFLANTTHYDTDQYGSVTGIVHEFSDGVLMTTLQVRGQPSARYREWHRSTSVGNAPTIPLIVQALRQNSTYQTITVRVTVADPLILPQFRFGGLFGAGHGSATITYDAGGLTVSPASGQTIAAALLTASPSTTGYVDFTVTRQIYPSMVSFTASRVGRVPATVSVEVPGIETMPQMTISILDDGSVAVAIDGPAWVESYKYSTSTSAFPTDNTVISSGTTANGTQIAFTLAAATLGLGDTIYVTAVPYPQASAAGTPGFSCRGRATRHDFSATKTQFIAPSHLQALSPDASIDRYDFSGGYVRNINWPVSNVFLFLQTSLPIPDGVTVTEIAAEIYHETGSEGSLGIVLYRVSGTGTETSVASVNATTDGWQTKEASCSEDTTGNQYRFKLHMEDAAISPVGVADADLRCSAISYTYTMPDSTKVI